MFVVLAAAAALLWSVVWNLISADIDRGMPSFGRWLIGRRAAKLHVGLRERYQEEWLAKMESYPTHIQQVLYAAGFLTGQTELLRACDEQLAHRNSRDVTVALTGVEAKGSAGNITP